MDYRSAAVLLIILCALGASAFAAPCQPGPLSGYLAPAFTCTEGPFTIKTFSFSESMGGLNPTLIQLIPTITSNQLEVQFLGNFTANVGQKFTYNFSYFIDPPPPIIKGEQIDLDPMGAVSLQTMLCTTAFPCMTPLLGTLNAINGQNLKDSIAFSNTSTLGLSNTFITDGTSMGASSGGFDNITFITPEPAAILLMASGLLGMLVFRSRAKVRQVLLQLRS